MRSAQCNAEAHEHRSKMTKGEITGSASPCASCKMLRRRCTEKCMLAPYFPQSDTHKFAIAHKVFGASAIVKTIQDLPVEQRAGAVESMVYEATARVRDPVRGCAGMVRELQKQVLDLQSQLATAEAEILKMQSQRADLLATVSASMSLASVEPDPFSSPYSYYLSESDDLYNSSVSDGELDRLQDWEPLWTYDIPKSDV